jgi:hypothetical protein
LNAQERQIGLGDLNECRDIKISTRAVQEFHKHARTDEPMGETDFADLILAISQLEDVRDIFAAPTAAEKVEIMNKWR